jgi:regulator of protease activity HflC (stomatin/prohibitin superfamily)
MKAKALLILVVIAVLSVLLSSCYGPKTTQEDQVLVQTKSGKIQKIEFGGGRHWSMAPNEEGEVINLTTEEFMFITDGENGKAWTSDSQPIIVTVVVEYRIARNEANITYLWNNKKQILTSTDYRVSAIRDRAVAELKEVTVRYTLLDMVGLPGSDGAISVVGREVVVNALTDELKPELEAIGIELVSLRIKNVDPADDEYEALLNEAAKAQAREKAADQNLAVKIKEQESAAIDNSIREDRANSDAIIREINARIYENDRAFELEIAQLMAQAISSGDVILFIPPGENVTYILNGGTGQITPIP